MGTAGTDGKEKEDKISPPLREREDGIDAQAADGPVDVMLWL